MKIIIVEDEAIIAQRIARLTRLFLGDRVTSLDSCATLSEARETLARKPPDLLLLDLNLNGQDGFDLLVPLLAEPFHVIIISAYKDFALRAFEYGVLDFVPKPIDPERLRAAFERVNGPPQLRKPPLRRLAIKNAGHIELIKLNDVTSIHGAGDYSEVVLASGKTHLSDKTLDCLAALLGDEFKRIHRSHLVRTNQIVALHATEGSRYEAELETGIRLPIGRSRISALRAELTL